MTGYVAENLPQILKWIGWGAVILATAAISAYLWMFHNHPVAAVPGAWGELGDFFGGVLNPAFSFLALLGLLMTLYVQSRELRLSRKMAELSQQELAMTRQELERSAEALSAQNEAINHQRFEQTFFAWLDSYRSIVTATVYRRHDIGSGEVTIFDGLEAFQQLYELWLDPSKTFNHLAGRGQISAGRLITQLSETDRDCLVQAIARKRDEWAQSGILHAPISSLVTLAEWIKEHHLSSASDHRQYISILRSQLSLVEQRVLLVCASGGDWPTLRNLIESDGLLDIEWLRKNRGLDFLWSNRDRIETEMRAHGDSSADNGSQKPPLPVP